MDVFLTDQRFDHSVQGVGELCKVSSGSRFKNSVYGIGKVDVSSILDSGTVNLLAMGVVASLAIPWILKTLKKMA